MVVKPKKINGKIYRPYDWRDTKTEAKDTAKRFRDSGKGSARVFKVKSEYLIMVRYNKGKK